MDICLLSSALVELLSKKHRGNWPCSMLWLSDFNFTLMENILSYILHFGTYEWYFHIVSENDEMARVALCDNPNWAPLSVLLGLVSCSVPIPLKAELLLTLAALAKTPSTAAALWHNLEASQILTTVPSTSSYQPRGIKVSKPFVFPNVLVVQERHKIIRKIHLWKNIYYKENIVYVYCVHDERIYWTLRRSCRACKATPLFHFHHEESINFFTIDSCSRENRMFLVTCFINYLSYTAHIVCGTSEVSSKCWLPGL